MDPQGGHRPEFPESQRPEFPEAIPIVAFGPDERPARLFTAIEGQDLTP